MKIILLTNEYPPHIYGGAGVHVQYLSRELARLEARTHEIQVLCFGEQKGHTGNLRVEGIGEIPEFPYQEERHKRLLDALLRNIFMTGAVREADVVHCHTWYTSLGGCLIKQLFGIPLVLTTHSLEPHRPWKEEQLGSAYRVSTWVEKTAYKNAEGVIAVSPAMKTAVHELYGVPYERIRVIPNGIDVNQYRPTLNPEVLSSYRIDPGRPFVLFVGRISRQKGVLHLIQAAKHLLPGVQLVLCAGAPDTEEIGREMTAAVREVQEKGKGEIIRLDRWVPRDDLIRLYSHASVFVCPSVYEPFGIINLEAMACGTPVVASAVGGIPGVVIHGETGYLVPFEPRGDGDFEPRDPERFSLDLAEAVNDLLRSPEKRRLMGRKSRERVEEHFSWESVARRTLEYYRHLRGEEGVVSPHPQDYLPR
jgi:glycogen synthase